MTLGFTKKQMCSISEEDESRNISILEDNSKLQDNKVIIDNKFNSVNLIENNYKVRGLNQNNHDEIEESYDQEFDEALLSNELKSNNLLSNDLNAIKNTHGHSINIQENIYKIKTHHNLSKNSSVNIDKLLQSKYSNYSIKIDENIDEIDLSDGKENIRKMEIIKNRDESEIGEEVIYFYKVR